MRNSHTKMFLGWVKMKRARLESKHKKTRY